jgi:hypothetical protein
MRRALSIVACAAPLAVAVLSGLAASAQTRDADELQTLTVLEVDPRANEIRARETGSTRIRTIELDDRTGLSGGALGGPMTLRELQPGDTIRVPGVAGSLSDRVRAERIQVLTTPPAAGATQPGAGPARPPSALDPGRGGPGALGVDPEPVPGRVGSDPGATDQGTRGTGSQTAPAREGGTDPVPGPGGPAGGSGTGGGGRAGGGDGS